MTAEPRTYTNLPMIEVEPHRVPPASSTCSAMPPRGPGLEPQLPEQLRAYAHRWLALAHADPGEVSERVEDFEDALHDSPRALQIADNPGLVALLGGVRGPRGHPADRHAGRLARGRVDGRPRRGPWRGVRAPRGPAQLWRAPAPLRPPGSPRSGALKPAGRAPPCTGTPPR